METADTTYGSDKRGVVWAYLIGADQPARLVDATSAAEWLAGSGEAEQETFLWLHCSLSNTASVPWLREHLSLPHAFYDSINGNAGSTRVEEAEQSLIAVIHDIQFDLTLDTCDVSSVALCVHPRVLVSARVKPLRSIDRPRALLRSGARFRSPAELFAQLLAEQASVLVEIVRRAAADVDEIEDCFLENRGSISRSSLGSLRRTLVRLQRLLAPEPTALFRVLNQPPGWVAETDRQALRQAAEDLSGAVADSAGLIERVKLLQEELAARATEQTNRTLFILTVVTVLALPINLAAGLLGMNVGGIPFAESRGGFWTIVIALMAVTSGLAFLALRLYRE